jgi:hypothetical protein
MTSKKLFSLPRAVQTTLFALALVLPSLAFAGPPLICHPYEIGSAKSLPGGNWGHGVSGSYDRKNLVDDTLELLTPAMPVIVRMETLRRAVIYATANLRGWEKNGYTAQDRELAAGLLEKLRSRSTNASDTTRALALFDLGFYAETLKQAGIDPAIDGYALIAKAAELRGGGVDPELEFALALASSSRVQRSRQLDHLAKARAGAEKNPLLVTNLASHFGKS